MWKRIHTNQKTYRFRLREEVVNPGDAPHALKILLCLNGDRAQGSTELPSCHCHLDTCLRPRRDGGTLRPAWYLVPLPQGQDRMRSWLAFGQLFCMDTGGRHGESSRLWYKRCSGHGGDVRADGEDGSVKRLQGLLPQLVERGAAHLATADTSFMAPRCLKLLKQEGCISRVLQSKHTRKKEALTPYTICPYTTLCM